MKTQLIALGGTLLGFAGGAAGGYFFAMKKLGAEYDIKLEKELAATKAYYNVLHKRDEDSTPEKAVAKRTAKKAAPKVEETNGVAELETMVQDLKYQTKPKKRTPAKKAAAKVEESNGPDIISVGDYLEVTSGYDQITLTYYVEDDVLVNESDDMMDKSVIGGDAHLDQFGYMSDDPNVLYIRNDKLTVEYEVIKNEGSYKEIVAGLPMGEDVPTGKPRRG